MKYKICIITVCLNDLVGLVKTADSIFQQTCLDYEWIVVDGQSSDGTIKYLKNVKANNFRFSSEKDEGIYDAMNKGVSISNSEYLLFLNAGDTLHDKNVLKNAIRYLTGDLVVGTTRFIFTENLHKKSKIRDISMQDVRKKYIFHKTLPHPSTFFSVNLFKKYGLYNTNYMICGDYDFYVRLICNKVKVTFIPICISDFYDNGISSNPKNLDIIEKEKEEIRKKNFSLGYRFRRMMIDRIESILRINQM